MDLIIQVLKGQNMAFWQAVNNKTGHPFADADIWGSDYPGTKPSDETWRAYAPVLLGAVLQAGVFTEGAGGFNDAQIRTLALEAGREVFVEKGQPVVIKGAG